MNLKKLYELWQDNCPEEVDGLARKRRKPKQWKIMLDNYERRKDKDKNKDTSKQANQQ
jgi:hypothetical protein